MVLFNNYELSRIGPGKEGTKEIEMSKSKHNNQYLLLRFGHDARLGDRVALSLNAPGQQYREAKRFNLFLNLVESDKMIGVCRG